jgi:hypothetical protein
MARLPRRIVNRAPIAAFKHPFRAWLRQLDRHTITFRDVAPILNRLPNPGGKIPRRGSGDSVYPEGRSKGEAYGLAAIRNMKNQPIGGGQFMGIRPEFDREFMVGNCWFLNCGSDDIRNSAEPNDIGYDGDY